MVGDVIIYMNDLEDPQTAEIEIMIAEPKSRGKEAILMMTAFATKKIGIHTFCAKIGESNGASLKLFQKMGFKEIHSSEVFKGVMLELPVTKPKHEKLLDMFSNVVVHR